MFETTVGTRKLDRDGNLDTELTQQFTPIFQALLSGALGGPPDGGTEVPAEDDFHRDPLAAPLPTQLSNSPAETVPADPALTETVPPSTLDAALLATRPLGTRLHAVPVATGGAHRAEPHTPAHGRSGHRAPRSGAHRAPEIEPGQPDADRPATSRGGRHRTLRAVVH